MLQEHRSWTGTGCAALPCRQPGITAPSKRAVELVYVPGVAIHIHGSFGITGKIQSAHPERIVIDARLEDVIQIKPQRLMQFLKRGWEFKDRFCVTQCPAFGKHLQLVLQQNPAHMRKRLIRPARRIGCLRTIGSRPTKDFLPRMFRQGAGKTGKAGNLIRLRDKHINRERESQFFLKRPETLIYLFSLRRDNIGRLHVRADQIRCRDGQNNAIQRTPGPVLTEG